MESDEENMLENDREFFVPERISLLIVLSGFVIMFIGTIITKELLTGYFDAGLILIFVGILLFMVFIYSRIYVVEHVPISLPESIRNLIVSFTSEGPRTGGMGGYIHRTISKPILLTKDRKLPATSSTGHSGIFSRKPTTVSVTTPKGIDLLEEVVADHGKPSPVIKPVTNAEPKQKRKTEIRPVTIPAPSASPSASPQFVDVLEESDRELESFIDQLIEE